MQENIGLDKILLRRMDQGMNRLGKIHVKQLCRMVGRGGQSAFTRAKAEVVQVSLLRTRRCAFFWIIFCLCGGCATCQQK